MKQDAHVKKETVILLHGLVRTPRSMNTIAKHLRREGYQVINLGYASRQHDVMTLANQVIPQALAQCQGEHTIHFVTHSLGGILVRAYLSKHTIEQLGRVVMLAPPNQGSEIVDKLGHLRLFKWINGEAGLQLGTDEMSMPKRLGAVDYELGVIAGTRSVNLILSTLMPRPNDGKVSVNSTKIAGMKDHLTLPVTHTFLMTNRRVLNAISAFLATGKFAK
ncbi:alpha/beta hydrolase [Motilimonas sp. 1_MG-2023]|uniref:esterase/lipase family protein n=1 Tax=Motilimonas sp. 1_MG-2023 TaxID=3062672 RepID=UPI0026E12EDA|nr:alpha/beta hydrolase [Motilimonas sp. 1_MG-2023]MDO6525772.1 alpha/beta hydrolase [Motilimonas sp. 1_MG-2023]